MRLVLLSIVLSLSAGMAGCASPTEDPGDSESAPPVEEAAAQSPVQAKATQIVNLVKQLLELDHQRAELAQKSNRTPEEQRQMQGILTQIKQTVAGLPSAAEWVARYVQEHRQAIQAGFESTMASPQAREKLGADEVRKLDEAVRRAGGVAKIIDDLTAILRGNAGDAADPVTLAQRTPKEFFFAIVGTFAGASAALDSWPSVIVSMEGLLKTGYLH
jgi:hypothetical protein